MRKKEILYEEIMYGKWGGMSNKQLFHQQELFSIRISQINDMVATDPNNQIYLNILTSVQNGSAQLDALLAEKVPSRI